MVRRWQGSGKGVSLGRTELWKAVEHSVLTRHEAAARAAALSKVPVFTTWGAWEVCDPHRKRKATAPCVVGGG